LYLASHYAAELFARGFSQLIRHADGITDAEAATPFSDAASQLRHDALPAATAAGSLPDTFRHIDIAT
jgi:hypothetical protein